MAPTLLQDRLTQDPHDPATKVGMCHVKAMLDASSLAYGPIFGTNGHSAAHKHKER